MALNFSEVSIELKLLTNEGISVGIELTDVGSVFPVGVIDLSVTNFDFWSFPACNSSFEQFPAFADVGTLFKVAVNDEVFVSITASTGSLETDVADGGSETIRWSSTCELDFIVSNFSYQGQSEMVEVVIGRSDFFDSLAVPYDVEAAGSQRLACSGGIVQAESKAVAESPFVLCDSGGEGESHKEGKEDSWLHENDMFDQKVAGFIPPPSKLMTFF